MVRIPRALAATAFLSLTGAALPRPINGPGGDPEMIARIREEGLQHSQVMDVESYMTDVLGARLTMSDDMQRAQKWALGKMTSLGLSNVVAEPYGDWGVTWDNEYVSVQMLEPDYSPMVAYPIAYTSSTDGKQVAPVMIAELQTKADLDRYRGKLKGMIVLSTPPVKIDLAPLTNGVQRWSDSALQRIQETVVVTPRATPVRGPRNPDLLSATEKLAFYKSEGVVAVLQCESGWLGAVRGYARPGAAQDHWSKAGTLASPVLVAVTPEHYNRMYRILQRGIPVKVAIEVRNKVGDTVQPAVNITGEIPGSDLKDQIVMIGAHFDTWQASPNASDNTSGTAVVLEAARILRAVGAHPRRTIRFALWSGEEEGLIGSKAYVLKHFGTASHKGPEFDKLSAYFNQDYGAGQYRGIYLQGNEAARTMLTAWMAPFRDFGLTVVANQYLYQTDHVSFDEAGLPGFQFLQDHLPAEGGHTNLDFFDTIQGDDLIKNAVVMASFAYDAAMSDSMVPRKAPH
ncbi:MAG TPA: M28 family peptidase [Gemmatimonadales bacterium]|jgi:Zn-dependent M28 family amino/carboxypeptidase